MLPEFEYSGMRSNVKLVRSFAPPFKLRFPLVIAEGEYGGGFGHDPALGLSHACSEMRWHWPLSGGDRGLRPDVQ
jgi:hypothetical protein